MSAPREVLRGIDFELASPLLNSRVLSSLTIQVEDPVETEQTLSWLSKLFWHLMAAGNLMTDFLPLAHHWMEAFLHTRL